MFHREAPPTTLPIPVKSAGTPWRAYCKVLLSLRSAKKRVRECRNACGSAIHFWRRVADRLLIQVPYVHSINAVVHALHCRISP